MSWHPLSLHVPCHVHLVKLLDSDQELYRNFPLTISERWQQEVAETVFDTINAETDRLEARKKAKNKQLGHEEGEDSGHGDTRPAAHRRDEKGALLRNGPRAEPETGQGRGRGLSLPPLSCRLRPG